MKIKKLLALSLTMVLVLISTVVPMSASAEMTIAENIVDVNFDSGTMTNNAGKTTFNHNHVGAASASGVITDSIRGSKAYKITIPKNASGLSRIGSESWGKSGFSNKALWFEMSFKCEGAVPTIHVNGVGTIIQIKNDGTLMMPGYITPTTAAPGVTITTDKWYHLVVAIDNIDKWNTAPRNYVWLDGKLVETDRPSAIGTADWYMSCLGHSTQAADASSNLRMQISASTSGESTVLFDNIKFYTTSTPVKDADKVLCFDPMAIYAGATVTSNELNIDVDNNKIYAPAYMTMGDVAEKLNEKGVGIYKGKALTDAEIVMESAVGGTIYARSTSGIGLKEYKIVEGPALYDIDTTKSAAWTITKDVTVTDSSVFTSVTKTGDLKKGDKIKVAFDMLNKTKADKSGVVVVAVYNNDMLIGCGLSDFTVKVGGGTVTSDPVEITYDGEFYETENFAVKAYIWNSATDRTSVVPCVELPNA